MFGETWVCVCFRENRERKLHCCILKRKNRILDVKNKWNEKKEWNYDYQTFINIVKHKR